MAFLDFMKERSAQPQPANENTSAASPAQNKVENLPAHVKAEAVDAARPAAQLMDRATAHRSQAPDAQSSRDDSREALIRNQGGQGKEQAAMSPTDHGKSQTVMQQRSQGRSRGMER
jgi:hypothetical protein